MKKKEHEKNVGIFYDPICTTFLLDTELRYYGSKINIYLKLNICLVKNEYSNNSIKPC